jgi:hypothetical protein
MGTCSSYVGGELPDISAPSSTDSTGKGRTSPKQKNQTSKSAKPPTSAPTKFDPSSAYATSKLALTTFAFSLQKHLANYKRPDGADPNARVLLVNPGFVRTPGMRRYLTLGSLLGLLVYLVTYPFWWLVLKSPNQGAQGFLFAAMEAGISFARGQAMGSGGVGTDALLIRECRVVPVARSEVKDESLQKGLWEVSEQTIEKVEKEGAVRRALTKKEKEVREESEKGMKARIEEGAGAEEKKTGSRASRKAGRPRV